MAGCFGNSAHDRSMESQLNAYLDEGADWERFCDMVSNHIPEDIWDNGCDDYINGTEGQAIINTNWELPMKVIAEKVIEGYKLTVPLLIDGINSCKMIC
jgi:hypothetical protein